MYNIRTIYVSYNILYIYVYTEDTVILDGYLPLVKLLNSAFSKIALFIRE